MYCLQEYLNGKLKTTSLTNFLAVEQHDVISFAGAGGKTSTLMALANELKNYTSWKILLTTTTKMYFPEKAITVQDKDVIVTALNKQQSVIVGEKVGIKLSSFPVDFLQQIIPCSDVTLIEADGAKRLPFKMPRENEPVYLAQSNKIVYLVGMSALNMPLQNLCRSELLQQFLAKEPTDKLSADDIIKVVQSNLGGKKDVGDRDFYVILNQVDMNKDDKYDEQKRAIAINIAKALTKANIKTALCRFY